VTDQTETWLPIPGYEGFYEISNQQRVRSLGREAEHGRGGFKRKLAPKILKTSHNNGYLVAYLCPPNRQRRAKIFYVEAAAANLFQRPKIELVDVKTGEEWRDIPGFVGYQSSTFGRIRSLDRFVNTKQPRAAKRWTRGGIMTLGINGVGYRKVELSSDGAVKTLSVHRLVALAFIPNPLNLEVVHHKDEDRLNNRTENLEWVSGQKNISDWFDRRRVVVSTDTIESIGAALALGKTPAEILAALPKRTRINKRGSRHK